MTISLTNDDIESLIDGSLRYMRAMKLPTPLPTNRSEYGAWREKAVAPRQIDDDAEDAWFEVDRLIAQDAAVGWILLTRLVTRCEDDDMCTQVATGPLSTFMQAHADAYADRIAQEVTSNPRFRTAYEWLQQ